MYLFLVGYAKSGPNEESSGGPQGRIEPLLIFLVLDFVLWKFRKLFYFVPPMKLVLGSSNQKISDLP